MHAMHDSHSAATGRMRVSLFFTRIALPWMLRARSLFCASPIASQRVVSAE